MNSRSIPILALLASLAGCGHDPAGDTAATPIAVESARPSDGPTLAPPVQLGLCASCHGRDGVSVIANTPMLAGRDRDDLLAAMQAYLDGTRDYPPMRAMLGPIGPADRERLADWFAAQTPPVTVAPEPAT